MVGLGVDVEPKTLLLDLLDRIKPILGEQFVGMYVYGSFATGNFIRDRSDVDFVVVTESLLQWSQIEALKAVHRDLAETGGELPKKLEGAYVPRNVIRRHDPSHPPVPTINEESFYLARLGPDWEIQRHVIISHDSKIAGPPPGTLIEPVEFSRIQDAILSAIDDWWEPMLSDTSHLRRPGYQPFAVLSMCRALYAIEQSELTSKEGAGRWAINYLPAKWGPLITAALKWRDGEDTGSIRETQSFMTKVIQMVRQRNTPNEPGT